MVLATLNNKATQGAIERWELKIDRQFEGEVTMRISVPILLNNARLSQIRTICREP